jgi:hypothetical protein
VLALTTTTTEVIVMATPSYKERMRAARAEASAKRKAEQAPRHRQIERRCELAVGLAGELADRYGTRRETSPGWPSVESVILEHSV